MRFVVKNGSKILDDLLGRDAGAGVRYQEPNPARPLGWPRLDADLAARRHRLPGVGQQVHQHLMKGGGVAEDRRQSPVETGDDLHVVRRQRLLHELQALIHDRVEVERYSIAR